MGIRANVDLSGIERKISPAQMRAAKQAVAGQILIDCEQYVPMLDGDLRASGHVGNGGESVIWQTVYAKAQYYGTNGRQVFSRYTTAGTGSKWYEKSRTEPHGRLGKKKAIRSAKHQGLISYAE